MALKPKILDNTTRIEIKMQKLNYSKINRELGWKPLWTLGKALEVTIDWYKNNLKLFK
jgi:dTDP-D-glucose 4,6-dehydratase